MNVLRKKTDQDEKMQTAYGSQFTEYDTFFARAHILKPSEAVVFRMKFPQMWPLEPKTISGSFLVQNYSHNNI
jgi:hypothetical protein